MRVKKGVIANVVALILLVAYIVVASIYYNDKSKQVKCSGVTITVLDSAVCGFVNPDIVMEWLHQGRITVEGLPLSDVRLYAIERALLAQQYVDHAQVYTTMEGKVHIVIQQREPVMRVIGNGYDFYVDSLHNILPPKDYYVAQVPMVSGEFVFDFAKDYFGVMNEKKWGVDSKFLEKLINFVKFVGNDDFLRDMVVQIYVTPSREIELVPRIGGQIIEFGGLEFYPEKLDKLKKFYEQSFAGGWWKSAKKVNVKFRNQIIVN